VSESTIAWRSEAETVVFDEHPATKIVARRTKLSRDMRRGVQVLGMESNRIEQDKVPIHPSRCPDSVPKGGRLRHFSVTVEVD